jgi:succinate dehydrogenase hydrophobic anchor subunit
VRRTGFGTGRVAWIVQALTGILLVLTIGAHWTAQHFVAEGGLREFAEVAAYLRQPWAFALETLFLLLVTSHAMLGVRAVVLDLGPTRRAERRITAVLTLAGFGIVAYGLALTLQILR